MSFMYPLGLLGLIGVPILIIVYILRSKYNEQTVPSTYLWTLSEKFFKRRNPLSGITGIISLILQILMVIILSLAISRPIFVVPNSASEYCFVIDASGSMNTKDKNKTYFDKAKDEIADIIRDANLGSSYTLISVSGNTDVSYERITDKKLALDMLDELECSDGTVEYSAALTAAQKYFSNNPSTRVYLATDKSYASHNNVEIVNVSSQNVTNYAISDVSGTLTDGTLSVNGNAIAYTGDATLTVELFINGSSKAAASTQVSVKAGVPAPVTLSYKVASYDSFSLSIKNKDDLATDNSVTVYNLGSEETYSILIVSETPFFLEAALDVLTDSVIDTVTPAEYSEGGNYGLYIFHSFTPDRLPDAAVWLINSTESVEKSGFGVRGIIELDDPEKIVKSASTATRARKLLEGVEGRDIYIGEYVKYSGMYTQFTTLFSYDSNPLIFAGVNALGNREVVFGFDLHKSDLPLSTDFSPLVANLLEYSCPDIVERTDYICGESAEINITANIDSVKAISPDGEEMYINTSTDVGILSLTRVGTYTLKVRASGVERTYKIYSAAPAEESVPLGTAESFSLVGTQQNEKTDGEYDPLVLMFVLLAIVFTADWMVYCYEKYQLR